MPPGDTKLVYRHLEIYLNEHSLLFLPFESVIQNKAKKFGLKKEYYGHMKYKKGHYYK